MIRIGVATLAIGRAYADQFPAEGGSLERYATRLNCTEINSSFHRPHQRKTYERWAATAPEGFLFSVKVPKTITHERRLADSGDLLDAFLEQASGLGAKLGPLLVQLPPSLILDASVAEVFFTVLRTKHDGDVVIEPRHASWFTDEAEALLVAHKVARVLADPAKIPEAARFGGWPDLAYARLHGSPRMYFSPYEAPVLDAFARQVKASSAEAVWVVFDNTASGAALGDALALQCRLGGRRSPTAGETG
jgi:uncharacterized protein YecE (DUF72 family)